MSHVIWMNRKDAAISRSPNAERGIRVGLPRMVSVDLIRQCLPPGGYAGQIGGVLRLFDR
jgi:hypothetical protein